MKTIDDRLSALGTPAPAERLEPLAECNQEAGAEISAAAFESVCLAMQGRRVVLRRGPTELGQPHRSVVEKERYQLSEKCSTAEVDPAELGQKNGVDSRTVDRRATGRRSIDGLSDCPEAAAGTSGSSTGGGLDDLRMLVLRT